MTSLQPKQGYVGSSAMHTRMNWYTSISSTQENRKLFDHYNDSTVNHESFHVAQIGYEVWIFLAIECIISDRSGTPLQVTFDRWIRSDGRRNLSRVDLDLPIYPKYLTTIVQLSRYAKLASTHLTNEIESILAE